MIKMTEKKIKEKDKITISLIDENIEVIIKYPKQTPLSKRKEKLDKLKEIIKNQ